MPQKRCGYVDTDWNQQSQKEEQLREERVFLPDRGWHADQSPCQNHTAGKTEYNKKWKNSPQSRITIHYKTPGT
jgi:hypothetical protein